jgi:hypothetical protein
MRKRKPTKPIPEPSKFDVLDEVQLFQGLETALGESMWLADIYRRDPTKREVHLEALEVHLETALGSCRALRRKVAL